MTSRADKQMMSKTVGGSSSSSNAKQSATPKLSGKDVLLKTANSIPTDQTIMQVLDHKNMEKTIIHKELPTRMKKSTKQLPVRSYPGEVKAVKRGAPVGAVYLDDLDYENNEEIKNDLIDNGVLPPPKNEDTGEGDLMLDADFLKIDQSKLPIDTFDNQELGALDRIEEWMGDECFAKVPFYYNYEWIWRPVVVLAYNEASKQFKVRMLPDGIVKDCYRLNLKFEKEDDHKFWIRRAEAYASRAEAKSQMRLDYYVSRQSRDTIRSIRKEAVKKIHARVVEGLSVEVPFPDAGSHLGDVLKSLTRDIIHWYDLTMKKTVLFAQLAAGPYCKVSTQKRFQQLKLPPLPPVKPVPYVAKVPCPAFEFDERLSRLENLHFSTTKEIIQVYRWLQDRWDSKFKHYNFVDVILKNAQLPFQKVEDFSKIQADKCDVCWSFVEKDLRKAFVDQLMDTLQDIFDFFQSDFKSFHSGALHKLFRVLELKVIYCLKEIMFSSIDKWLAFVEKYTKEEAPDCDSEEAIIAVDENNVLSEIAAMTFSEEAKGPSPRGSPREQAAKPKVELVKRTSETIFPIQLQPPLFQVELVASDTCIVLSPSLSDIQSYFVQPINFMVEKCRAFYSIEPDMMSLLNLEPTTIMNIDQGDELFKYIDDKIAHARASIEVSVNRAMRRPLLLVELFSKYDWLCSKSAQDYLDGFIGADPPVSATTYREELTKLDDAIRGITNLSFDLENFDLVRVNAKTVKEVLVTKAAAMREGLAELITAEARQQNMEIISQYETILQRISVRPANERELADLRDFIEQSKKTVESLKVSVERVRANLGMLESFHVAITVDDMGLSWSTLEYPSRVEASGKEVEITLDADKVRMMDKLALEKEQFEKLVENLGLEAKSMKVVGDYANKEKVAENINNLMDRIAAATEKGNDFNMREKVFGFAPSDYFVLDKYVEDLQPFYKLWNMSTDFHNAMQEWLHGEFKTLEGNKIEEDMTEWWKTSYKLAKSLEEEYSVAAGCALKLREETSEFRKHLPVIQSLASKALKSRHWDELGELLGKIIDPQEDLTLQMLLDLDANGHIEQIQEITIKAEKEYNLERNLQAMKKDWEIIEYEVKAYRESGTFIVGGLDDIITLLDDHIVKTQTMRGSPYIKPIEMEAKVWEFKLKYAQNLLDQLIACQRTWMYLEPIFGSDDIIRQLPTEARRFSSVDTLWRKTMKDTTEDPNFMTQSDPEKKLKEKFEKANEKLDEITKGLNDYLEMKRLCFPRFFFLSNDELLEILSQTKEPRAVQPHLGKCFEGINKVHFEKDLKITVMISAEGEEVKMDRPVDPETSANKGNVEKWLVELESIQWDSLRTLTVASLEQYTKISRKQWILNWAAQVILGVSCVYWTVEVTQALTSGGGKALAACNAKLDGQLREMVELVRGKLSKLQRKTMGALTTIDVHNRDVVAKMVDLGTTEVQDFEWMSQLRYYWEDSWRDGQAVKKGQKTLVARIVNARCLYGYEYLGNTMRLVITALTDRCYRTMVGAIDLLYGGAPEGPAGTGKTETVKDLSKAVAIHCVVFNCSDGLDYLAMAKFFKGLAGCGSWCCFDEFNRINIEVLSVIAQQILIINQGKRENKEMFHFEGTYMKLNTNCNVFITMNPGYAGRAELPDNLKALFRPCAMMVPDYAMIGEIRLYSFGFEAARENAQKIVRVLQLSSEQLSSQKHYDYGMRAVNSILVACGNLRQLLGDDLAWTESRIVLRSINDVNLAKFLVEDIPLFEGITSDLFPGISLPEANYGVLPGCLQSVCDNGVEVAPGNTYILENKPSFYTKTIQLYEMVLVRHGVMVVGQTCSGKTACIHNLAKGMTKAAEEGSELFQKVEIFTINPKAVTSGQLYGLFDENTHEFVDGILAVTFRNIARDTSLNRKWMLFDGPVDAVWIENMNTVLDDNKKLCLTSGEIIKMSDPMTMFFEAEDLEQASPATVSRVGMIFCETRNIGWTAVVNVWLRTLPEVLATHIKLVSGLFDWLFPVMSYYVLKFCKQPTIMQPQELVFSLTRLLKCMLDFDDGCASDVPKVIEGCFIYALIWSCGVCVDGDGRKKFDAFLRLLLSGDAKGSPEFTDFLIKNPDYTLGEDYRKSAIVPPEGSPVYDFIFDTKTAKWSNWLEGQPTFKIERDAKFNSIVVPTIDTIRNEWNLEKLLRKGFHVMCTGDTGTGKSVCVKNKLLGGMPHNYQSISLNFSAQTSANQTQDLIDAKLDKRRKGVLGPPLGNVAIIFVDDLNMPAKEEYGAQPPIEILRQWMDHQGWYDRKENEFRRLVDIQFCAAMGPPGGGRTKITQRYVRHFNMINFTNFSDESLARVFGTILDWRLSQGFAGPVKQLSGATVMATISIYNTIASSLLPTPAKSHYTFNLRDLSKVFQGVLLSDANNVKDKDSFIRLWSHECLRVFHDRLIDDQDRQWFKALVSTTVKDQFNTEYKKIKGEHENLIFCNFGDPKSLTKPYCELADRSNLAKSMDDYLDDFNQMTNKPMNLVLFGSAVEHIARISRIINQPYGNALLVGVGGSGRKSLTTLAIHIADYELFKIEITKSYGLFEWREDIKSMMNKAGVLNKPTVFVIDDTQIVKETFLEDINGILNTGEVANLFNNEEMGVLMEGLSRPAQEAGVNSASTAEVYNFFVSRVRTNLHLVLCLSPIGDAFRRRLRMFPSLVNCCTIDWFAEWPEEALQSVANFFLANVDLDANEKKGVVDVCVNMQVLVVQLSKKFLSEMGRNYYVTPTSYLELINTFKNLLSVQRTEVFDSKARYDNGLAKLKETADQVNDMQVYLEDLQPKLKEATIATDALLVTITADRKVASEQSKTVEAEAKSCNVQAAEANALKTSCEADLAEAIPALEAAERALNNLDKSDITEMKAMKKPSLAIKMTMAGICIMLDVKPDKKMKEGDPRIDPYWIPATKELLNDPKLLDRLKHYDRDNMDPNIVAHAKTFTDDPDFDPEVVAKKGSVAASGLARWVHAMVKYDRVARGVAPKRAALKQAETTLKEAMANLAEKQAALKEVMDKLAGLEASLKEAEDKKISLKNQVEDCEAKLKRADALIKGLGGEKTRWTEMSDKLSSTYANVTGDVVLASGVIAYMGAFISSYRDEAITQWSSLLRNKGIACSEAFSLKETLGSPVTIRSWIINRLPNDSFSVENAIMLFKSNRWPLMIDPQGQANKWVKKMEEPSGIKVVKQNQANFVRTIENAIQFGTPVLLENVPEALDPILESILLKQIVVAGGVATIRLGDATIEYDKNFRFYITTKLRNPHYPPELCVKVNLLNFMATAEGLQDQMLGRVVAMEQKELELQRQQLIVEDAENQRQLKEIEDKILFLLKNAEGNILDDEVLIDTLADSKKTANFIGEKVKIAEQTQARIAKVRKGYIPVAFQASQLFFCIADLASVDPMYQYSLDWYIGLYETAIEKADKSKNLDDRLRNLNDCFTFMLYKNVCRSLFEKDKLLFSFLLTTKIMLGLNKLDEGELRFFLQGSTSMDLLEPNPFKEWLTDNNWNNVLALCDLPNFGAFKKSFKDNGPKWAPIMESPSPFELISTLMGDKIDTFKKLCVLRCFRLDVIVPSVMQFIAKEMTTRFIEPPPFDMKQCFGDSKCYTPLIFVLTPGAAPMTELLKLAEELGFGSKLLAISLGQGQGPIAENAIVDAASKGSWVCLQNCHLCISWMPTLERICEEFSEETLNSNFRLWLTSEPSENFPPFVLQNGVKMTNEPPKGMRANLLGSLLQVDDTWFTTCNRKNEFKKLLFGLCFFHASVRERKKFGPLGWNIQYVFSLPDLRISMDQLRIFLDDLRPEDPIPYAALAYLVGECNYGGRVTDDKDRRCIMGILDDFYTPKILDDAYRFSISGVYYAPEPGTLNNYRDYVRSLPYNEGPEVFGLHENANISSAISEANALLDTALSLQPRAAGGGGKSWGETLAELARDISQRIPPEYDIEKALIMFPVRYDESMNTVLTQELIRFNRLILEITVTLRDVQKALKGLVVMSAELEAMGNSMVIGKVPVVWARVAYPSLKPLGAWTTDFLDRLKFLGDWMEAGEAPCVYWVSGFFFTQAFITGTLQNFARKYKMPIDKAEFDFEVLTSNQMEIADNSKPEDGAYLRGLFLEGARWNSAEHILDESHPRELFVQVPYIHLLPKRKDDVPVVLGIPEHYTGSRTGKAHVYMCPVYKTSFRQGTLSTTGHSTNFVMFIRIPIKVDTSSATSSQAAQKHWIKRGTAMLTQLDF